MASPVLVGAVTVLVVIVGVYLAYNANKGLPFVPTYDIKAELPNGQKLIAGNEVRLGGFLVGNVNRMRPIVKTVDGKTRTIALLDLKLNKQVDRLPVDTTVRVRPKSALGLKYLDIVPGHSKRLLRPGDTIPLSQAAPQAVEYEDVFSTFDSRTRANARLALKGYGDSFAERGASINQAIAAFNPFFTHLTPVMKTLDNPRTQLDRFFASINQAAAEVVPVAKVQAGLFGKMARTFDAISACASCLQQTIAKAPGTLATGASSFQAQRPFYADFTTLSRDLRPTVATLHAHLGTINAALETGTPVLKRTPVMNRALGQVFGALDNLGRNPITLLALQDLHLTFAVLRPFMDFVAPYNTVCNNANAFFTGLATHMSEGVTGGTSEAVLVRTGTNFRHNSFNQSEDVRPADVPANRDPQTYVDPSGDHYEILHAGSSQYGPAVDAQGNADCEAGQTGYIDGPLAKSGHKYQPANIGPNENFNTWEDTKGGGSHVSWDTDIPGLQGGSFVARKLGIASLRDVP